MKKIIYLSLILCISFFSSCDTDDNDLNFNYQKKADIEFIITSSNKSIFSKIETQITSGTNENGITDLELTSLSYSNYHLPFKKTYIYQTIKYSTLLGLSYADDSIVEINDIFEPYTIDLEIKIDNKIVASKSFTIESEGQIVNLSYTFYE